MLRCGGARLLARVRLLSWVRPSLQPKHAVVDHVLLPPLNPSALSLSTSQDITCLFQKEGKKKYLAVRPFFGKLTKSYLCAEKHKSWAGLLFTKHVAPLECCCFSDWLYPTASAVNLQHLQLCPQKASCHCLPGCSFAGPTVFESPYHWYQLQCAPKTTSKTASASWLFQGQIPRQLFDVQWHGVADVLFMVVFQILNLHPEIYAHKASSTECDTKPFSYT